MSDSLSIALSLAKLGLYCFPWDFDSKGAKRPKTEHGHIDATTDAETLAVWFSIDFPNAKVGVEMGRSGLVALDLDDKVQGVNGRISVEDAWLEIPDTYNYKTNKGEGRHYIYTAPKNVRLNGVRDYRGLSGVDRRGGSSWLAWWSEETPNGYDEFNFAPNWLLDEAVEHTGSMYGGAIEEWLKELPDGEPNENVLAAIERVPDNEFGHPQLIERQMEAVRLAAEGNPGVAHLLSILRDAWLRPPYNTDAYRYEYDIGLDGAVAKFGAADELIANLPVYLDALQKLPNDFDLDSLQSAAKPKKHYFATIKVLVNYKLDSEDIASLIWNSKATKDWAREWGIEYLFAEIDKAKNIPTIDPEPEEEFEDITQAEAYPLLTEAERESLDEYNSFTDLYCSLASDLFPKLNMPYHRMSSFITLAMAFGCFGFVPMTPTKKLPLNIFAIGVGRSGTGKSDSVTLTRDIWKDYFGPDKGYNSGTMVSSDALREVLLERDEKPTLFSSDEAAGVLLKMLDPRGYQGNLVDEITAYFDGWVDPIQKKSAKELSGKSAQTAFSMRLLGTPDRVTGLLTEDQFESGFLARPIWYVGEDANMDDNEETESQVDEFTAEEEFNPAVRGIALDLITARDVIGNKKHYPILASRDALRRIGRARDTMARVAHNHPREAVLGPSIRRLGDNIRKVSALFAMADGSTRIETFHVLKTLEHAEEWLRNLVWIADKVSSSSFQRDSDEMNRFIIGQGGTVLMSKMARTFKRLEPRDYLARLESLKMQGRIKESSDGKSYEVNK